jgi:Domain of unknown function (DUF5666)
MQNQNTRWLLATVATSTSILLAACGGGSDSTSNTTSTGTPAASGSPSTSGAPNGAGGAVDLAPKSVAVGSITGFGSVIVDGVTFSDTTTTVLFDTSPDAPLAQTTSNLKLGMQVEMKHANGAASEIFVASSLRGPVTAIDATNSKLTVLGQVVQVVTAGVEATSFEGFSAFADIKANDWIEVHAIENADGSLKATRIERESAAESTSIKIAGKLSALDATAKTFKLGAMTINYANTTIRPTGASLANAQRVVVFSDAAPVANVLAATKLRVREVKFPGMESGNIGGLITDFVSTSSFMVAGIKVDASKAKFDNGSATDLVNGAAVRVKGSLKDGVLTALALEFKGKLGAEAGIVSVKGVVTDFVSASSFKLRGQTIDATGATFEGGVASDLGNGALIQLIAQVVNGQIKAKSIKFIPQETQGAPLALQGKIQSYNATLKTFSIAGTSMKLSDATVYVKGTAADVANDKLVEAFTVKGVNGWEVKRLEFKDASLIPLFLRGIVSDVTATSFKLAGVLVAINANTSFEHGTVASLVDGVQVMVKARNLTVGGLTAVEVEIVRRAPANLVMSISGSLSDFVSKASFRVAGQKVDASAALFVGGAEADLVNGKSVLVEGRVEDGVFKASKLTFQSIVQFTAPI